MTNFTERNFICPLLKWIFFVGFCFTANAQSPGGISSNLRLWLKADSNVTPAIQGGNVTNWGSQTGSGEDAQYTTPMFSQTVLNPIYQENIFNFHPSVRFNGTSNISFSGLQGSFSPAITSNNISAYVVSTINNSIDFYERRKTTRRHLLLYSRVLQQWQRYKTSRLYFHRLLKIKKRDISLAF
ncbi:hypothetical protein [Flavobacterium ustbae]|uniref:hypothetical protein n=1 Tax=Flavobacterium ustbae TaxID=2488790 RepID=UPI000F77013B|nr:hypothetical protein [Flavobacterium ustbae]